ncbi:helix-turn-helix domain-containing protein [Streptomyces venezuelae]|uniref:helix-turn-helix domain-containing protein n=1 Tax=Streptomyces venezuelae TaxID=54571 RepID=UPI0034542C2C
MHEVLRATSDSLVFEVSTAPYLVLDTDLRIRGANAAYLRATGREREELLGAYMFDAFPDNPQDAGATGVRNLTASLERVLRRGAPDDMGIQRYDIPDTRSAGAFHRRAWSPVNSPLTDADGGVVGVLHHVEDVTAVHETLYRAHRDAGTDTARQPAALLRRTMLALTRYERAARRIAAGQATPGEPSPAVLSSVEVARRDRLWHAILHAARQSRPRGCAGAVCEAAVRELLATDAAVITLHGEAPENVQLAVSSPWGQRAEELQYVTGQGPSLAAYDTGEHVLVPDLDHGAAGWPLFTAAAAGIGVGAVFAYPLRTATATLGTLTLYRRREPTAPAGPPADAQAFAEITTAVLLADMDAEIIEEIRNTANQDDVNTAIGLVAATQHIRTSDALTWLQTMARAQHLPLADLARDLLLNDQAAISLLVTDGTALLPAATAPAVLLHHAPTGPAPADTSDAHPATLRRAIAFIEANAASDIGIADIAAAAGVTTRAVQLVFRRHLDATPLQYLRRIRLDRAHRDLLLADPAAQSVTAVAYRWGFSHPGRFAADYRTAYGESPSHTLRRR